MENKDENTQRIFPAWSWVLTLVGQISCSCRVIWLGFHDNNKADEENQEDIRSSR
jgi:hypothetical protein